MTFLVGLLETLEVLSIAVVTSVVGRQGLSKLIHTSSDNNPAVPSRSKQALAINIIGFSTICVSIGLIELVVCEICDWLSHGTRVVLWSLTTKTLLVLLTAVLPTAIVMNSAWIKNAKRTSMLVILVAYVVLFWSLGSIIHTTVDDSASGKIITKSKTKSAPSPTDWSSFCLLRVGFLGIVATAALAGFSSVSTPYEVFIARPKPVTPSDIERLERTIEATRDLSASKRLQMEKLSNKLLLEKQARSKSSLMLKMMSSLTSTDSQSEYKTLDLETNALDTMLNELDGDLLTMKTRYGFQQAEKTLFGKLQKRVYMGFAVYCIYRLIRTIVVRSMRFVQSSSSPSLSSGQTVKSSSPSSVNTPDAIVTLVASLLHDWTSYSQETLATLLHLTITGALFLATFSSTLTTLKTLTKAFPPLRRTTSVSGDLASLITADLLGVYVIATALTLRSILPASTSAAISVALKAPLDIRFVENCYENTFTSVAIATAAALFLAKRLSSGDLVDSEPFFDEEALVEKYE